MKYLKIRSRNKSAKLLAKQIPTKLNIICRLGSFTPNEEIFSERALKQGIVELNTVKACQLSNDKLEMKKAFDKAGVNTSIWLPLNKVKLFNNKLFNIDDDINEPKVIITFPCIIKHRHSSKGEGIYYIPTVETFESFMQEHEHESSKYIIEHYYTYSKEYRVHVSENGVFYACRKMLLNDVPVEQRFHRHHVNTVWILPDNPDFQQPNHWEDIKADCVKAIKSIGLSIGCLDVLVTKQDNLIPDWKILESNSAPALGEGTAEIYKNELINLCAYYEEKNK